MPLDVSVVADTVWVIDGLAKIIVSMFVCRAPRREVGSSTGSNGTTRSNAESFLSGHDILKVSAVWGHRKAVEERTLRHSVTR